MIMCIIIAENIGLWHKLIISQNIEDSEYSVLWFNTI